MATESLTESLFGGGLTDSTGIFGMPTTNDQPPKRQKRQAHDPDDDDPAMDPITEKTSLELWEERRKKYAPPEDSDDDDDGEPIMMVAFALIRERNLKIPEDVFAEEIGSTVKAYGLAVAKRAIDPAILDRLRERAVRQREAICQALEDRNLTYDHASNSTTEVRFQEAVVRGRGRIDARYRYDDMDQDPNLPCTNFWADHALLHNIVGMLLYGEEHLPQLVYAGWIFSFPGSDTQPWHQDGIPLFPGNGIAPNLPPYAINVFIPLEDEDAALEAGPTEFVVGSHRMEVGQAMEATKTGHRSDDEDGNPPSDANSPCIACPILKKGDLLFYDYRICHRGTSNLTHVVDDEILNNNGRGRVRTVLYLMYARPWFKEHLNFGTEKLFDTQSVVDNTMID